MNSDLKQFFLFLFSCLIFINCKHETGLSSEEAFIEYKNLREKNRDTNYKIDPEKWLDYVFECKQIVPKIRTDHELVLNFYHNSAYVFDKLKLYRESLNTYKEFFNYYDTRESQFSPKLIEDYLGYRTFAYRRVAFAYENLGLLDSAYLEHQKNLDFTDKWENISNPAAQNDFGMFLTGSIKDTVLGLDVFETAYQFTSKCFPDHDLITSIRDNLAQLYFKKLKLDQAYDHFYSNYHYYKKYLKRDADYKYEIKALETAASILEILREQNKIKTLNIFYNDVSELYNTDLHPAIKTQELRLGFLKIEHQYLLSKQDYQKSHRILEDIKILSDSIIFSKLNTQEKVLLKINDLSLNSLKSNYLLEKNQKEAELLNHKLIIWLISIASFAFLCVLTFLYFLRKQHVIRATNKQVIAEQELELVSIRNMKLNLEIESKQRDLADFAIKLTHNQEWAKVLANKLEQLKTTRGRERKKLMDDFENEVIKKTTFDTNTKEFYERLDKLSDTFYSRLHSEFPDLSRTEKRLCSLIRLKIDSRNIAIMQNITLSSLNKSRYRLRKKMNLGKDLDLDKYIQDL